MAGARAQEPVAWELSWLAFGPPLMAALCLYIMHMVDGTAKQVGAIAEQRIASAHSLASSVLGCAWGAWGSHALLSSATSAARARSGLAGRTSLPDPHTAWHGQACRAWGRMEACGVWYSDARVKVQGRAPCMQVQQLRMMAYMFKKV